VALRFPVFSRDVHGTHAHYFCGTWTAGHLYLVDLRSSLVKKNAEHANALQVAVLVYCQRQREATTWNGDIIMIHANLSDSH